jgi:dihydrofolate synthase/folylpolyglutamate synthase
VPPRTDSIRSLRREAIPARSDATRSRLQARLEALYGQERRRDKLGLGGTEALLAALGNPERRFRSVHVAGTNGKGSVCTLVERVLREAGENSGLYTSPHLVDFRERIRVRGRWADEAWLADRIERIDTIPGGEERTFFEVATALGFDWFAHENVSWAVVEVGLGGRLDCTNVLAPAVSVITSIGLDHTEILGTTLEAIAAEKAGILKPDTPAVLAPGLPEEAHEVIVRSAGERGAPIHVAPANLERSHEGVLTAETRAWGSVSLADPFRGRLPLTNHATALEALEVLVERGVAIPREALEQGFARARWPGRHEPCPSEPRLWWDGAHNVDGMRAIAEAVDGAPRFGALVLAVSRDKDLEAVLDTLRPIVRDGRLIATCARVERARPPDEIARTASMRMWEVTTAPDVATACAQAIAIATPEHPALLTGSLFAVGEAMEAFGGAPGEMQ